ncbi:neprilysin-1-like [Rhipicephalus sanguineus]|uniref:neprilysin-1-like n=1 Tax=Rhipicephalus sanguineus TaxID=34632 RepID=UPI0020C50E07|nr:neprilysin-1-like [Rhipicephalus sanguineus]
MVGEAKNMVDEIRNSYVRALRYSTWLSSEFRQAAIKKIRDMVSYVGSPGRHLEPDFVEELYKPYPDAPLDLDQLFPTWIKALGLSTQYMWMDTKTPLFDDTGYIPFYTGALNDIIVPTTSMLRPFMYPYGVLALNYGGLGTMIGGEMMHALDPRGLHSLEGYVPDDTDAVMKEYTKRALCLRKSRKSVLSLSGQQEPLSEELDSENLADLVGTKMAYDAFDSLVREYRDETPAGLNMSVQQLFFFNNCVKWCTEKKSEEPDYAKMRSRCIVPLMNMREFSSAFGCTLKTPMSPREKCTFWD